MSSGKAKRKREDEEVPLQEDPEHDELLMRQAMSSPRVQIVPGLWRRIVRRRRSKNDSKPWICSCGYLNNPTQHLFFDLPRFKCKRKGCKEIIPDTYEFEFSLADIEANGTCPLGNVKDQEHRPHCMTYSSATNAEVTERVTRILMGEEVKGKGPMICMKTFMHKLKVRKQLRNVDIESYGHLGFKDFRRIHGILEGGVKVKGRSQECKISGTSEVAQEFSLVCKDLAEGNPLLAIIRTGKGFDNLKWNEIYKPPKKSAIVMGKSEGLHCIALVGGGMRKKRKMYYKFVNTHGMGFCPLSNLKRKDGIKGGFGNIVAEGLVTRPVKFIRYRKGVPRDSNLSCSKLQEQSIGGRIRRSAATLKRQYCILDERSVRTRAAAALGKPSALSTRVDPLVSNLLSMLQSGDESVKESVLSALKGVIKHAGKSVSSAIRSRACALLEDLLQAQADDIRSCAKKVIGTLSQGVPILVPGLCLPKALQPFLPIFQQGLISGSAETKEQAAEGLGELIDVTSEKTLKEVVVPITGPLIRILGDRFPWQVKSAILSTLTIIIMKGGIALKPFLPQLQTTFVKCLQDNNRSVQTRAAAALGKLSALSTRVDPLVSDLLSMLQSGDESVKESMLSALKGVIKHAGKSVSSAIRSRACALLEDLLQAQADDVRSCAAKVIGTLSQYMEETEISDLVQILLNVSTSSDWCTRHGALLAFSSISMHSPSKLCHLASFPSLVDLLKDSLKDDKFPVREVATRTLGRILCFELQSEAGTLQLVQLLVLALRDDSSEVRRRSLSCIKAAAKINHSALATHHSILGLAIADALKDSSMPVRLAAERCALHVFQLTKGPDNVTAAQKYLGMTGLEVKKIAKLNEESDGSETSDDDKRT